MSLRVKSDHFGVLADVRYYPIATAKAELPDVRYVPVSTVCTAKRKSLIGRELSSKGEPSKREKLCSSRDPVCDASDAFVVGVVRGMDKCLIVFNRAQQ